MKMIELVVLTTEPASRIKIVANETYGSLAMAIDAMNNHAAVWKEDMARRGLELDDFSLPHNDKDPTKLDCHNTWLTANGRENEFIAAWREIDV